MRIGKNQQKHATNNQQKTTVQFWFKRRLCPERTLRRRQKQKKTEVN